MFVNFNKIAMDRRFKGNFQNDIAGSATKGKRRLSPQQILELLQKKELRLADNPKYVSLANLAAVLPEDAVLQEILGMVINKQDIQAMLGTATDKFWENYPVIGSTLSNSNNIICGFMPNGEAIELDPFRTSCNIGILGRTGSSKSSWINFIVLQLVRKGFLVVIFQQKTEYDDWATDPELAGRVLPLRFTEFKVSRFQEAPGVPARTHLHTHFNDFAGSFGRVYAQRLGQDIAEKKEKKLPKGFHLPLSRLIHHVEEFMPGRGSVESNYRESLLYALKEIQNCFRDVHDFYYSDFYEKLYQREGLVTITVDAPAAASTDAVLGTVRYLYSHRQYSDYAPDMFRPVVFVLEDATILVDEKSLHGVPSPLIPMSFLSRKYRIGFIVVSHNISTSVSPRLLPNLESIFLFGISDEDPRRIQRLLGCSYEQAQVAQTLEPGSFIAIIPSFHGLPVFGRFPEIKPPRKLSEQERQAIVQPFQQSVKAIKYIDLALPAAGKSSVSRNEIKDVPGLTPIEVKFLILAGTCRRLTKTKLYEVSGLNRRAGKRFSDLLEKKDLIITRIIGRLRFVEVTTLGWDVLKAKGIDRSTPKTNGGFVHELAVELIETWEKHFGRSVEFEVDLLGKRLDLVSYDRQSGKRWFYNVGITDIQREINALKAIAKLPVVQSNELVFVVRDKKTANLTQKTLKKKDWSKDLQKQIVIRTIGDFAER